jgi:hypothetical protein
MDIHLKSTFITCTYPECQCKGYWKRQNTSYVNEEDNWAFFCDLHHEENDLYWEDMWKEHYRSVL